MRRWQRTDTQKPVKRAAIEQCLLPSFSSSCTFSLFHPFINTVTLPCCKEKSHIHQESQSISHLNYILDKGQEDISTCCERNIAGIINRESLLYSALADSDFRELVCDGSMRGTQSNKALRVSCTTHTTVKYQTENTVEETQEFLTHLYNSTHQHTPINAAGIY